MEPISIALALAKFVPDIVGLFSKKRGEEAHKAASTVSSIAEAVTGEKGKSAVAALEASPELALEFEKAVMADKHIEEQMAYDDRQDARDMYELHHQATDDLSHFIMAWNLPAVMMLVGLQIAAMFFFREKPEFLALISTTFGFIINALLNERQQVTGFRFGSSVGSKAKDIIRRR